MLKTCKCRNRGQKSMQDHFVAPAGSIYPCTNTRMNVERYSLSNAWLGLLGGMPGVDRLTLSGIITDLVLWDIDYLQGTALRARVGGLQGGLWAKTHCGSPRQHLRRYLQKFRQKLRPGFLVRH